MEETFYAVYRNGSFVPVVPCNLPDETRVVVRVQNAPNIQPPLEQDPEKRKEIMRNLIQRMQSSPLPADAPKLSREQMHER